MHQKSLLLIIIYRVLFIIGQKLSFRFFLFNLELISKQLTF